MANYSTTTAPLPWMEPYLQDAMGRAQQLANTPYQQSPGTYTGPNPYLTTGWDAAAARALEGNPVFNTAATNLRSFAGGKMFGTAQANKAANTANPYALMDNPYLTQSINNAQADLARNFNMVNAPQWAKAMQSSGSFGNSGVAQAAEYDYGNLANAMGRIGTDMRFNAYNLGANLAENAANRRFYAGESLAGRQDNMQQFNRNTMLNAIGMAPTFAQQDYNDINALLNVGAQAQGFDQARQNQNQQWFQEAQQFPQQQLNNYLAALGINAGGTQTTTQPDPSKASQVIGGALTGSALLDLLFGKP